jgi:hypothetical protein
MKRETGPYIMTVNGGDGKLEKDECRDEDDPVGNRGSENEKRRENNQPLQAIDGPQHVCRSGVTNFPHKANRAIDVP